MAPVEKKAEPPKTVENNFGSGLCLYIPRDINDKIMHWIDKADFEVSGFGSLDYDAEHNYFVVTDVCLLKQKVTGSSTEIDPHAIGKAMFQLKDRENGLKWHWHSHVKMGVFWSTDDMEIIRSYGQQGWIVATVFNQRRESRTAFYTTVEIPGLGVKHDIFTDDIKTSVYSHLPKDVAAELDRQYNALVEVEKPTPTVTVYNGGRSVYDPNWVQKDFGLGGFTEDGDDRDFEEAMELDRHLDDGGGNRSDDLEYDDAGYAKLYGDWVYNPLQDKELESEEAQIAMIDEMNADEISFLEYIDADFRKLTQKYMAWKAGAKEVTT